MKRRIRARDPKCFILPVRLGSRDKAMLTAVSKVLTRGNLSESVRVAIRRLHEELKNKNVLQ